MNFWHLQMNLGLVDGSNLSQDQVLKMVTDKRIIGTGEWKDNKQDQCKQFKKDLKVGDIVMVRNGIQPLALVQTISDSFPGQIYQNERSVKIIELYDDRVANNLGKYQGQAQGTLTIVSNKSNPTGKFIIGWHDLVNMRNKMSMTTELLKYKKQIILQGPPGTGKTWLAKKIAVALTVPEKIDNAIKKTNEFFKNFNPKDLEIIKGRKDNEDLIMEFNELFPRGELHMLTLEKYYSPFSNFSFFSWIRENLKHLKYQSFSDGHSLVSFENNKRIPYFHLSPILNSGQNEDEQMKILAQSIFQMIQEESLQTMEQILGNDLSYQILCSYYPEKYFPICNKHDVKKFLGLVGLRPTSNNLIELNQQLSKFLGDKKKEFNIDIKNYEFMHFLKNNFIYNEWSTKELKGECKLVQFHPSYTYEDFVRGIVVETNDDNQPEYRVVNKILGEFAEKALKNHTAKFVLIIDEINRANLPSVLGELIYALEYRYNKNDVEDTTVESMYALKSADSDEAVEANKLMLPPNLFIIGTMNTADRSVGHIDYAIRRRFAFLEVLPSIGPIKNEEAKVYFEKVSKLFVSNYYDVISSNAIPKNAGCLISDFKPEEVWIGHSYFLTDEEGEKGDLEIRTKMKYEVLPLLKEYVKDGILKTEEEKPEDPVQMVISELNGL